MNYDDHDLQLGYNLIPTGYLLLSRDVLSDESKDLDKVKCFYWFCSLGMVRKNCCFKQRKIF